jgi:hypothetical protein
MNMYPDRQAPRYRPNGTGTRWCAWIRAGSGIWPRALPSPDVRMPNGSQPCTRRVGSRSSCVARSRNSRCRTSTIEAQRVVSLRGIDGPSARFRRQLKWFRMTTTTPENATPSPRTKDEQEILEVVARVEGWDYVNRHAESILDRARAFGDL